MAGDVLLAPRTQGAALASAAISVDVFGPFQAVTLRLEWALAGAARSVALASLPPRSPSAVLVDARLDALGPAEGAPAPALADTPFAFGAERLFASPRGDGASAIDALRDQQCSQQRNVHTRALEGPWAEGARFAASLTYVVPAPRGVFLGPDALQWLCADALPTVPDGSVLCVHARGVPVAVRFCAPAHHARGNGPGWSWREGALARATLPDHARGASTVSLAAFRCRDAWCVTATDRRARVVAKDTTYRIDMSRGGPLPPPQEAPETPLLGRRDLVRRWLATVIARKAAGRL